MPDPPDLPPGVSSSRTLALGTRASGAVQWLVVGGGQELQDWLAAIVTTLPTQPQQQQQPPYNPQQQPHPPQVDPGKVLLFRHYQILIEFQLVEIRY